MCSGCLVLYCAFYTMTLFCIQLDSHIFNTPEKKDQLVLVSDQSLCGAICTSFCSGAEDRVNVFVVAASFV